MSSKKPLSDDQIINILLTIQQDIAKIQHDVGELKGRITGIEKRLDSQEKRLTTRERFDRAIVVMAGIVALIAGFIGTWLARVFGFR